MNKESVDQTTLERQVRALLVSAKKEETLGGPQRLERAGQLRHQAQELSKGLPADVVDRLLQQYSSD